MLKNSVYSVLSDGLGILIKFIAVTIIANKLGAVELGAFNLVLTFTTLVSLMFLLGSQRSIVFYNAKSGSLQSEIQLSFQLLILILGLFASFSVYIFFPILNIFIKYNISNLRILLTLCTFAHVLFLANQQIIISYGQFKWHFVYNITCHSTFFFLIVVNVRALSIYNSILSFYIPYFLSALLFVIFFVLNLTKIKNVKQIAIYIDKHIKYGLKSYLYDISNVLSSRMDYILISYFLGPYWLGQYSLAKMLSEGFLQFSKALNNVVFQFSSRSKNEDHGNQISIFFGVSSILLITGLSVMILCSDLIVSLLYGDKYHESLAALKILLVSVYFMSMSILLSGILFGKGYPSLSAKAGIYFCLVSGFSIICFMTIKSTIEFAAISAVLSSVFYFTYLLIVSKRSKVINDSLLSFFIPKR